MSELYKPYPNVITRTEYAGLMLQYITEANTELWVILFNNYNLSCQVVRKKSDDCESGVGHAFVNTVLNSIGFFTKYSEAPALLLRYIDPISPTAEVLKMISAGIVEGLDNLEAARCALEILEAKEDAQKNYAASTV